MSEGQKKRNIGRGMKPRGNQQVKPRKGSRDVTTQSTTEGQGTTAGDAVLEGREGNSRGGNLDPETAAEELQNLESNGGEKGPETASDDGLEAALRESQNGPEEFPLRCTHGRSVDVPCDQCQAADMGNKGATDPSRNLQPLVVPQDSLDPETFKAARSTYERIKFTKEPSEAWITKDGIKAVLKAHGLGDQPDGSCGFIVKVQEGQVEMVKAYAESDGTGGVTVEKWLSDRIFEFIEAYSGRA